MKERKSRGYWQNLENALAEARELIKKHKLERLPSTQGLCELGYYSLIRVIKNNHGGFHAFRSLLGEEKIRNLPNLNLKDLEYAIEEANTIKEKHGFDKLPGNKILCILGHSSLVNVIAMYHGGFPKFRKAMGEDSARDEFERLKNLEYTIKQAKEIMKKHGFKTLPSSNKLSELGYHRFIKAIFDYHRGIRKFRKALGEPQLKIKDGTWKSLDYTLQQARKVIKEHGLKRLPSQKQLFKLGYAQLNSAIIKYHKGYHKVRELLGEESQIVEVGTWKDQEYTIQQAKRFKKEHDLDILPSKEGLRELGYSALASAINKYHEGFPKFRRKLGEKLKRLENNFFENLDFTIQYAKEVMQKHDLEELPGKNKLRKLGYGALTYAIKERYGGFPAFRQLLHGRLGIKTRKQELLEDLTGYARQ